MREILRTGGKINIFLRITGVRPDGYHELFSLFMPLPAPWDELVIEQGSQEGLIVESDEAGLDCQHNTLTKAYGLYGTATGYAPPLRLTLHKGIPLGAGLGGGSADAGLLLQWLQAYAPSPLEPSDLVKLAARVGADVPFFLDPQPMLVQGIGDVLTPCEPGLETFCLVLLCPHLHIATAWAFTAWDTAVSTGALTLFPKTDKNHRSCLHWGSSVDNDFEPVVFASHPFLGSLKGRLLQKGACATGLSGSGASLFGLFREEAIAKNAVECLACEGAANGFAVYGPLKFGPYAPSFSG